MTEVYNNNIKSLIGRVTANAVADNYFPLVGDTIKIEATTRWGKTSEWQTQDGGGGTVTTSGNLLHNKDSKSILITGAGAIYQKFIARNHLFSKEVLKSIYAMAPQPLPYFDLTVSKEIIRTDGVASQIRIAPENGYAGEHTIVVRIFKENETESAAFSFTNGMQAEGYKYVEFFTSSVSDRGIYDVEVDCIDTSTGKMLCKRINKLITITPRLCAKPSDTSTDYEVSGKYGSYTSYASGKIQFELRLWRNVDGSGLNYAEAVIPCGEEWNSSYDRIPISALPSGTTLCLKLDPKETETYKARLLLTGDQDPNKTNANGTPNFSRESPLVITHDRADIWEWGWCSYGAVNVGYNCRNIVFDGLGYHNTGIHFFPFDSTTFTDSCFFLVSGTSDWEMFGCDIDGAGFAGVTGKTDPSPDMPWWWRANGWEFKDLKIHHCKFRNTVGEGVYLGYFYSGEIKKANSAGQEMTYSAHLMRDIRLYRCKFSRNGFDSVQINNSVGVEFCYNELDGCGYRREPNQGSAFSCVLDGKIYNCTVKNNYNILGVFGPFLSKLEIFNCILSSARFDPAWALAAWSTDEKPETEICGLEYDIHNNIVKSAKIANLVGNINYHGYTMNDNIFITENGDSALPGYFTGSGNIFMQADLDYENIDSFLKVADSANYNYQIAHNSRAVTAGRAGKSPFDMRGYKNWFTKVFHSGPYMGKYKDLSIIDVGVVLSSFAISDEAVFTLAQTVPISLAYNDLAIKYRIGETSGFSGVSWIDIPAEGDLTYTLSPEFGKKTVYAQVASNTEESAILSTSIVYQSTPLSLDSITLSGGYNKMAEVIFNYSGSFVPAKYRLGEMSDLSEVTWVDCTDNVTYMFDTAGDKTIYGQLQDADGNISEIKSARITVLSGSPKIILSLGWANSDFRDKSVYDAEFKLTKINFETGAANIPIYRQDGTLAGEYSKLDNWTQSWVQSNSKGYSTGTNSGIYPDAILERNIVAGDNKVFSYRELKIVIPAGRYKIKLLCNTIFNRYDKNKIRYGIKVVDTEYLYSLPSTYVYVNNVQELLELTVDVPESGFNLQWGTGDTGGTWMPVPLNVVEIEKVL